VLVLRDGILSVLLHLGHSRTSADPLPPGPEVRVLLLLLFREALDEQWDEPVPCCKTRSANMVLEELGGIGNVRAKLKSA